MTPTLTPKVHFNLQDKQNIFKHIVSHNYAFINHFVTYILNIYLTIYIYLLINTTHLSAQEVKEWGWASADHRTDSPRPPPQRPRRHERPGGGKAVLWLLGGTVVVLWIGEQIQRYSCPMTVNPQANYNRIIRGRRKAHKDFHSWVQLS